MSQTKQIHDGGPAFPGDHSAVRCNHGMSLREWYAGLAMQGMLAYSHVDPLKGNWQENASPDGVAEKAFAYADAMVAFTKGKT